MGNAMNRSTRSRELQFAVLSRELKPVADRVLDRYEQALSKLNKTQTTKR